MTCENFHFDFTRFILRTIKFHGKLFLEEFNLINQPLHESMTKTTSSIVIDVSAIFVDNIIFVTPGGAG